MARLELKEVLEIIIERNKRREAHRFLLTSNGAKFGDLENIEQQYNLMEVLLKLKFPDNNYSIQAFGLLESINVVKM